MKNLFKRTSAVLLALMIVISLLAVPGAAANKITTPATGYDSADDVVYVTSGKYIANWGARGEDCVFLSKYAQSFYTGNNTFDKLSALSGGSSQSNAPQSALYSALQTLVTSKQTYETSYDATRNLYCYTDCVKSNYSQISSFYSGKTLSGKWDSGNTWNREHTWPKSKDNNTNGRNDIMMLRPTSVSENSSRGNAAYGSGSGYYDPGVSTRGDVARIVLYVYVRWGNNTSKMWGTSGVMQSLDVLLQWMAEDPVDTWEMGRNDAVQSITGTRNVFVDYPEYAWLLFGKDVPAGISTPSDNDGVSANPGGSGTTPTPTPTPDTSYTQISELKDGDKIVIVNPASNMAYSTQKTGFYNIGVDVSGGFSSITNAEIFTAKKNSDGTWSFTTADGQKLAMAESYSSLNETGVNDKWELSSAGTKQFYLKNTGRNLYLEWFVDKNNWSAYNPGTLTADYALAFYVKASAVTPPQPTTPATTPTTPATQPTTPATQPTTPAPQPTNPTTQPTVPESQPTNPPATQPSSGSVNPPPMPTNPVQPPVVDKNTETEAPDYTIYIVIGVAVLAAAVATVLIFARPKKTKE